MPKVSVILPNYNHGKYLDQRVESILGQHYDDLELIVLDDASTDNSLEVLEKYKSRPGFRTIVKNTSNSGSPFFQWKKGIEMAEGDYIWIAESDDFSDLNFLNNLVAALDKDQNLGVVFSSSSWVDKDGTIIHKPDHEKNKDSWAGNSLIINELLIGNLIYNVSSSVFRKDLISKIDFDKIATFKYAGDWFFWVQIMSNTKVARISKRLNFFRRHAENVSFRAEREGLQFEEGLKVVSYIFKSGKVSFWKARMTMAYWARRFSTTELNNQKATLRKMPLEMQMYVKILNLFNLK